MFKSLFILTALSVFVLSCKKEKMVYITATNVATGERMPNLKYFLVELKTGSFGEKSKTIREGFLDANGEAHFSLKIKKAAHVIRVVEPDNHCYRENISLTFGNDENFEAHFKFAPRGYLKNNY